jgi:GMP synthase (glutamine-hydrolysing)
VGLCKADPWSIESYAQKVGQEIMESVGNRNVFMLVSGGVDSTVAFVLLNEVLGSHRVQGLLVDTGLMRKDEVRNIRNAFELLGIENLRIIDASEDFFNVLHDVFDPEAKRKVIGDMFLAVQKKESEAMNLRIEEGWMLGQGTIYPDTIETGGTRHADKIKTHHNRVEAVQKLIEKGLVIEPLKELYKDEVRRLGEELGLPHELVWRHPFPGPGLGVRILCCEEPDMNVMLDDPIKDLSAPHVVLPIQSVGVQGDGRTYRHAVVVFADNPLDPPHEYRHLATSIPNRDPRFNRVLLCLSHQEPISFLAHRSFVTRERADLLREADEIVDEEMRRANLYEKIWQFPVVLLPVGVTEGGQTIVLRPVESTEAMTANAAVLPSEVCDRITKRLLKLKGIDSVLLDLTHKPPATIEWELFFD